MKLTKKKTKYFRFCPGTKNNPDNFTPLTTENKSKTYTQSGKLLCDWTNKKNYLFQYGMLNFYVRQSMVVDKVHDLVSFKQSKWLE